ncbi:MAG: hypothetical protein MAG431_02379 [Chloroflexi bacterium]|nr:hypothetical protein [Chloroflexota bacterium]
MSTVQIRSKGVITLPIDLRRRYAMSKGDVYTLVDLGDGSFLMVPQVSQVAHYGDRVAQVLKDEKVSVEEMLQVLAEERETYYQDHYVED